MRRPSTSHRVRPLRGGRAPAVAVAAAVAAAFMAAGLTACFTPRTANPAPPVHYEFSVDAPKTWQDSGVFVKRGYVVHLDPQGQWGDPFSTYGPEGNPQVMKSTYLVLAPAFALIMKLSTSTNVAYYVGGKTNIVAERSGTLMFRCNIALPIGVTGTMRVDIAASPDTDGDGLSDYEEIEIWKTDPLNPDSNGDGFTDLQDVQDRLRRAKSARR